MDIPYQFSKELEPGTPSRSEPSIFQICCQCLKRFQQMSYALSCNQTNQPTLFPKHPFSPYKGILLAANNLPILGTTKWPKCWQWCHPPARESLAFVPVPWPCFAKTTPPPSSPARNVQKRPSKILHTHFWSLYCFYLVKPYLRGKWGQMTCFSVSMVRKWFFKKYAAESWSFLAIDHNAPLSVHHPRRRAGRTWSS